MAIFPLKTKDFSCFDSNRPMYFETVLHPYLWKFFSRYSPKHTVMQDDNSIYEN